jgi:hypothetical protein
MEPVEHLEQTEPGSRSAGWTRAELIDRANNWARRPRRGYPLIDEDTFHEWQKDKLLSPASSRRGRGFARGREAGRWHADTYKRLLHLVKWSAEGIRLRRVLRLMLWFDGEDVPIDKIRNDLVAVAGYTVHHLNREMRTDRWQSMGFTARQERQLFPGWDSTKTTTILSEFGLDPATLIPVARKIVEAILPEGAALQLGRQIAGPWFGIPVDSDDLDQVLESTALKDAADHIFADIVSMQDFLTSSHDDNALLRAIHAATGETLISVRNFVLQFNDLSTCLIKGLRKYLEIQPNQLGAFVELQPYLLQFLGQLQRGRVFPNPPARYFGFAVLLVRSYGNPRAVESMQKIADLHVPVLLKILIEDGRLFDPEASLSGAAFNELIQKSEASPSQKERWIALGSDRE